MLTKFENREDCTVQSFDQMDVYLYDDGRWLLTTTINKDGTRAPVLSFDHKLAKAAPQLGENNEMQ